LVLRKEKQVSVFSDAIVADIVKQIDAQIALLEEKSKKLINQPDDGWIFNQGWLNGLKEARDIALRNS
jgi:hypothetical protein